MIDPGTFEEADSQLGAADAVPSNPPNIPTSLNRLATEFIPQADEAVARVTSDFEFQLRALARRRAKDAEVVQTKDVIAANTELLASRVSEVANIGVVIILPIALFLLGVGANELLGLRPGENLDPKYGWLLLVGGLMFGLSIGVYFCKLQIRRLFNWRRKTSPTV